jgi:ketosteroid isomerase-like protein
VSEENLDLVRKHYVAWSRGDIKGALELFADDVEWHGHPQLPEPGPYRSRAEVERWMSQFREAWGELEAEPVELVESGDWVVALVHMTGRGRGSGVAVSGGVDVHEMRFRDGKLVYFRIHPGNFLLERDDLTEREFELLILRVQERKELPEIAEHLGVELEEAEAMLERAHSLLRELPESEHSS